MRLTLKAGTQFVTCNQSVPALWRQLDTRKCLKTVTLLVNSFTLLVHAAFDLKADFRVKIPIRSSLDPISTVELKYYTYQERKYVKSE